MSDTGMDAGHRSAVRAVLPVHTLRVAKAAARRALLHRSLSLMGRALLAGASVGLLFVFVLRGLGKLPAREGWAWSSLDLSWGLAAGLPMAAGALIAIVWAIATRWTAAHAAWELDQRLALRDRLSSALALASGRDDPEFVALAILEAEEVAQGVDPARAVGVKVDWTWTAWPLVLAGAIALGLFMPALQHNDTTPALAKKPATAEAVQDFAKAIDQAKAIAADNPVAARQISEADAIEQELRSGKLDEQTARTQAASTLDKAARTLEESARQRQEQQDELKRRLADLQKNAPVNSDLARALTKGDVTGAADEALKLSDQYDQMSPQERAAMARELDRIAKSIDQGDAEGVTDKAPTQGAGEQPAGTENRSDAAPPGSEPPPDPRAIPSPAQADQSKPDQSKPKIDAPKPQSVGAQDSKEPQPQPNAIPPSPAIDKPTDRPPANQQTDKPQAANQSAPKQPANQSAADEPRNKPGENQPADKQPSGEPQQQPHGQQPDQHTDQPRPSELPSQTGDQKQGSRSGAEQQPDQRSGQGDQNAPQPRTGKRSLADAFRDAARQLRHEPTEQPQSDKPSQPQNNQKTTPKPQPENSATNKPDAANPNSQQPQPGQDNKNGDRSQGGDQSAPREGQPQRQEQAPRPGDATQPQSGNQHPAPGSPSAPQPQATKQPDNAQNPSQSGENAPHPDGAQGQPRPGDHPKSDNPVPENKPTSPQQQQVPGEQPQSQNAPDQTAEPKPRPDASAPQTAPNVQPSRQPDPGKGMSPQAIERLAKELQQFAKDAKQGEQNRQDAQRLRKQAEDILKNASPEERQMLQKLARDLAAQSQGQPPSNQPQGQQPDVPQPSRDQSGEKPQGADQQPGEQTPRDQSAHRPDVGTQDQPRTGGTNQTGNSPRDSDQPSGGAPSGEPGTGPHRTPPRVPVAQPSPTQTQPVDARGQATPSPSEHVIADYFSDKPGRGTSTGPSLQQGVTDAAKGAEKAIEQQNVPSQYSDLVRRVFKRYIERVQPEPRQIQEAPDAPRK